MVKHVLKDGSVVEDISGYVIPVEEFESLYVLIKTINQKGNSNETVSASN